MMRSICLLLFFGSFMGGNTLIAQSLVAEATSSTPSYTFRVALPTVPAFVQKREKSVLQLTPQALPFTAIQTVQCPKLSFEGQKAWSLLVTPTPASTTDLPLCGLPLQGASFNLSGKEVFLPCLAERLLHWAVQSLNGN